MQGNELEKGTAQPMKKRLGGLYRAGQKCQPRALKLHAWHHLRMTPQTFTLESSVMLTQLKVYGIGLIASKAGPTQQQLLSTWGTPTPNVVESALPFEKLL